MRKIVKFCTKKTWLIGLWALSLMLALAILIPGYIADNAQGWMNSRAGQYAIKSYVTHKTKGLGYKADIGNIHFDLPEAIELSSSTLSDGVHDIAIEELSLKGAEHISTGRMKLKARYQDIPLSLTTDYALNGNVLDFRNISVQAPDLSLSSTHVSLNMDNYTVRGAVSGTLKSLSAYQSIIRGGHKVAPVSLAVNLGQEHGVQNAHITLKTPQYQNTEVGVSLSDLDVNAILKGSKLSITNISAGDEKGGTLKIAGDYDISSEIVNLILSIQGFHTSIQEIANGLLDADLSLIGNIQQLNANGTANIKYLEIKLPDRFSGSIAELDVTSTKGSAQSRKAPVNVALDIQIHAPQKVFVRGWGLDAEFGGDLKITGSAAKPYFDGGFSLLRGRYSEFGRNFKLKTASLMFAGQVPPEPRIDVLAETKVDDVTANVKITGQATKPAIGFSATPAMPEDQVLSHILFGKTIEDISPFQAAQLAATLGRLSGTTPSGGGLDFDPVGAVRSAVGLDDLHVETDAEGGVSVGAGKYIGDNVYLEVEAGNGEEGGSANVEIELTPNITLESEIGQDANGGAGIFWKWDY